MPGTAPLVTDREFLIVTNKAAAAMRTLLDRPTATPRDMRNVLLAVVNDGRVRGRRTAPMGEVVTLDSTVRVAGGMRPVTVRLCWGLGRDGQPALSPDGKRRCVFVTEVVAGQASGTP